MRHRGHVSVIERQKRPAKMLQLTEKPLSGHKYLTIRNLTTPKHRKTALLAEPLDNGLSSCIVVVGTNSRKWGR